MPVRSLRSSPPHEEKEQVSPYPQNKRMRTVPPSQTGQQRIPVENSQKLKLSTYTLHEQLFCEQQFFTSTHVISCWLKLMSLTEGMFPFRTWWHSSWKHPQNKDKTSHIMKTTFKRSNCVQFFFYEKWPCFWDLSSWGRGTGTYSYTPHLWCNTYWTSLSPCPQPAFQFHSQKCSDHHSD